MYQRYYKQRKFGKIFSFALVIGSGLKYYIQNSLTSIKSITNLKNIEKYEEYLTPRLAETISQINFTMENRDSESKFSFKSKNESRDENERKLLLIQRNLKNSDLNDLRTCKQYDDLKNNTYQELSTDKRIYRYYLDDVKNDNMNNMNIDKCVNCDNANKEVFKNLIVDNKYYYKLYNQISEEKREYSNYKIKMYKYIDSLKH